MKTWIVPSNDHIFRIDKALLKHNGIADWRETKNFAIGDIIYMYKTRPEQCIRYKFEVIGIHISLDDKLDQKDCWVDMNIYYSGLSTSTYVRFRLLAEYDDSRLHIDALRQHGVNGNIQSSMVMKSELLAYVKAVTSNQYEEEYTTDYAEDDDELYEGALIKVQANRYERNRGARQQCLNAKGYRCAVCDMDFEEKYGAIGHHFIEVHHIVPISSIGSNYHIDPIRDLVPVCSNCHAMLHQKSGKHEAYTVEELKNLLK